jgi:plastocyanin
MAKKLIVFAVVVLVGGLLLAVLSSVFGGGVEEAVAPTEGLGKSGSSAAVPVPGFDVPEMTVESAEHVVVYGSGGFSPNEIRIKSGDTVVFRNESSQPVWPASALHPAHAVYDGTSLNEHCAPGATPSFDSCRGIEPGGEWAFVFNKTGTWRYHDHLSASRTGTIFVE